MKKIILNSLFIIILFLATMSFLDEFHYFRDFANLFFISFGITALLVFIWNNIIKKLLDKIS